MKNLDEILGGQASAAPQKEKMSPEEVQAKMDVIKQLMEEMMEAMGGQVKSGMDELGALKKVTVAAPTDDLLSKGLEVAKDVVPEMDGEVLDEDHEAEEMPVEEKVEDASVKEELPMHQRLGYNNNEEDLYSLMQKKKKNAIKG